MQDKPKSQSFTLFVSTTLRTIEFGSPSTVDRQWIDSNNTIYYRLTPDYYAWLRHRMTLAKKAMKAGKLPLPAFNQMRSRFNAMHDWAVEKYGKSILLKAIGQLNPENYDPPSLTNIEKSVVKSVSKPFLFPQEGQWSFTENIPICAVDQVDQIHDQAINLGWSKERLYQNRGRFRFPCGQDYGLVCFLGDGRTIGEVTKRSIEIIGSPPNRNILRFYNPDVEQPWIRKTEPENEGHEAKEAA